MDNLDDILLRNFSEIELKDPLFYNSPVGIRFEMGGDNFLPEKRLQQVVHRAVTLFRAVNDDNDDMYFVLFTDSWDEYPVTSFENEVLQQFKEYVRGIDIKQINKSELEYRYKDEYEDEDTDNIVTIRYYTKLKVEDLDIEKLITDIAKLTIYGNAHYSDVGDIFLVNETKCLIFHLYDDRGLDIVAREKETLKLIYEQYNEWILDFDRKRVEKIFEE